MKIILAVFTIFAVILVGGISILTRPVDQKAASRSGTIEIDLGVRDTYGSTWQGRELLDAINRNPDKAIVTLTARNPATDEYLSMSADLSRDTLIRRHGTNGREKSETWNGFVIERIRGAAEGNSLNDTPVGKRPAIEKGF